MRCRHLSPSLILLKVSTRRHCVVTPTLPPATLASSTSPTQASILSGWPYSWYRAQIFSGYLQRYFC